MMDETARRAIFLQLMLSLTPRWQNVCICRAYPWPHHRNIGKCLRDPEGRTDKEYGK